MKAADSIINFHSGHPIYTFLNDERKYHFNSTYSKLNLM